MTTKHTQHRYHLLILTALLLVASLLPCSERAFAAAKQDHETCPQRQYIFSWSLNDTCLPQPRGGSSKGAPVTLISDASPQWRALQQPGLSPFERDRQAILAMAGGYRASFEFLETIGYPTAYKLAQPYQSWGTEYIYVLQDQGDFISLQHIMVMYFQQDDGTVSAPMVMKHWRQDWQYQNRELLEYAGNDTWQTRTLTKEAVRGSWSQSVYQVDDSPRYASFGRWQHNPSFSVWESGDTWRPLPRREYSVRDDYQIMQGRNRHIILPTGWVQEEENFKQLSSTKADGQPSYLAKELGNNRYQLITGFDWSAGDEYWKATGPYWQIVREQWQRVAQRKTPFTVRKQVKDTPLFMALFELAEQFAKGELKDPEATVSARLRDYVQYQPVPPAQSEPNPREKQ